MSTFYPSAQSIARDQFVLAVDSGPCALQQCWEASSALFNIDSSHSSRELGAASPGGYPSTQNAIQRAVSCGNVETMDWLIAHGANVDSVDSVRRTPLLLAMQLRHWEMAQKLLHAGANLAAATSRARYNSTVTSLPAFFFAFSHSLQLVEFLTEHGKRPLGYQLTCTAARDSFSLLSCVTDCQQGGLHRPRPQPCEVLPLMCRASQHVTAAQHYALCDAPLVCNATLDGAIVYLTGQSADGMGAAHDTEELCVRNRWLLAERSAAIVQALKGRDARQCDPFPVGPPCWVSRSRASTGVGERMLPAVVVAVWGSRCRSMHRMAQLCGAPKSAPDGADSVPFPSAPVTHTLAHEADIGPGDVSSSALLAAVAACQVGGRMCGVANVRHGIDFSPAAVRCLTAWAAGVLLCTVRQLQTEAMLPEGSPGAQAARDTLAFYVGGVRMALASAPRAARVHGGEGQAESYAHGTVLVPAHRVSCVDAACELLQHAKQERRLVNPFETVQSKQRWAYCMVQADVAALLGFATWRLRRSVLLRRRRAVTNST